LTQLSGCCRIFTVQEFWLGSVTLPQRSGHSLATEIAYQL
jgi:hypothetical protein